MDGASEGCDSETTLNVEFEAMAEEEDDGNAEEEGGELEIGDYDHSVGGDILGVRGCLVCDGHVGWRRGDGGWCVSGNREGIKASRVPEGICGDRRCYTTGSVVRLTGGEFVRCVGWQAIGVVNVNIRRRN